MKILHLFVIMLLMVFVISCKEKKQTPSPEALQTIEEVAVAADSVEVTSEEIKTDLDEVADDLKVIDSIANQ